MKDVSIGQIKQLIERGTGVNRSFSDRGLQGIMEFPEFNWLGRLVNSKVFGRRKLIFDAARQACIDAFDLNYLPNDLHKAAFMACSLMIKLDLSEKTLTTAIPREENGKIGPGQIRDMKEKFSATHALLIQDSCCLPRCPVVIPALNHSEFLNRLTSAGVLSLKGISKEDLIKDNAKKRAVLSFVPDSTLSCASMFRYKDGQWSDAKADIIGKIADGRRFTYQTVRVLTAPEAIFLLLAFDEFFDYYRSNLIGHWIMTDTECQGEQVILGCDENHPLIAFTMSSADGKYLKDKSLSRAMVSIDVCEI